MTFNFITGDGIKHRYKWKVVCGFSGIMMMSLVGFVGWDVGREEQWFKSHAKRHSMEV